MVRRGPTVDIRERDAFPVLTGVRSGRMLSSGMAVKARRAVRAGHGPFNLGSERCGWGEIGLAGGNNEARREVPGGFGKGKR